VSLATAMSGIALVAASLGPFLASVRTQRAVVARIRALGGGALYGYQMLPGTGLGVGLRSWFFGAGLGIGVEPSSWSFGVRPVKQPVRSVFRGVPAVTRDVGRLNRLETRGILAATRSIRGSIGPGRAFKERQHQSIEPRQEVLTEAPPRKAPATHSPAVRPGRPLNSAPKSCGYGAVEWRAFARSPVKNERNVKF
jgi:hypothetical protein